MQHVAHTFFVHTLVVETGLENFVLNILGLAVGGFHVDQCVINAAPDLIFGNLLLFGQLRHKRNLEQTNGPSHPTKDDDDHESYDHADSGHVRPPFSVTRTIYTTNLCP